jgi:TonB family protein
MVPDFSSTGPTNGLTSAIRANALRNKVRGLGSAEILTDTMGVNFGPYLTQVQSMVRKNWLKMMPPSVYPPILKQGKVSIEFFVLNDGKGNGMVVHSSSGDVALDRAAWVSITASDPLPPLPEEFPGLRLGLRFYFFYNRSSDIVISPLNISPSADVRVPAGSTLKFSASRNGTTDVSVTWSVSGPSCSKSACGSISDSGIYTAPVDIPDPPMVIVAATLRAIVPALRASRNSPWCRRIRTSYTSGLQAIVHFKLRSDC